MGEPRVTRSGKVVKAIALIYAKGCVTLQELYEALGARDEKEKSLIRGLLHKYVKNGKLTRPMRGVYCRPDRTP